MDAVSPGYDLGGRTPGENTIRLFRDKLTASGTLMRVMKAFDWRLQKKGYIPMGGQIVDASLVPAPKQRNTDGAKEAIKAGKSAKEIWRDDPGKAAQKDTNARWTLNVGGKVRYRPGGTPLPMIPRQSSGARSASSSTAGSACRPRLDRVRGEAQRHDGQGFPVGWMPVASELRMPRWTPGGVQRPPASRV
ncbi:MAG: hypothetical protein WD470_04990 [Rhodospirillaceae bacterium]